MHAIFIADAHLQHEGDENYQLLMEFLDGLKGSIDTLFILGDLFEFWVGYETVPFTHYLPILARLEELVKSGVEIVYVEGNHDFNMGPFFTRTLGARVYPDSATIPIEGKNVYLCHGDNVNSRDYSHRLLRWVLHSPIIPVATHIIPPAVASWIAEKMSAQSKKKHGRRRHQWDYTALLRSFAAERFREGCDVVVSGHFHIPFKDEADGTVLLSLGDWITHFTYGEWRDGVLSLKRYRDPEPGAGDR